MLEREFAEQLIQKAGQDEFILRKLIQDPGSPEEGRGMRIWRISADYTDYTDLKSCNDNIFF